MTSPADDKGRENVRVRRQQTPAGPTPGDPDDRRRRVRRLRALARLMDNSFEVPGLGAKVGVDPIIGLIPGIGDSLSAAISLYIVYEGHKLGASRDQLLRMVGNIAIDLIIGAVPVLGDVFDFAFKANIANLKILGIDPDAEDA